MADPRNLVYVPVDDLQGDERNPKDHDTRAVRDSIDRFGFIEPVTVDGRTGTIISGHGRVKALKAMQRDGDTAPAGVKAEGKTWLVPVVAGWESRTDVDAAGALIALNRTVELGGWVDETLLELLHELGEDESGFEGVGFTEADVENIRERLGELGEDEFPDFDDIADVSAKSTGGKELEVTCPNCEHHFRV